MPTHVAARPGSSIVGTGVVLFGIGLIAIAVTFIQFALGDHDRPLWQNLLGVLAPVGFALAVAGRVRDARAENRAIAAAVPGAGADRSPVRALVQPGRTERTFARLAAAEATSWLLLIVATIVKYTNGDQTGVHILGPVHGALFTIYVALALGVAVRRRWTVVTLAVVLIDAVVPGGGFLVARRPDLARPTRAGP